MISTKTAREMRDATLAYIRAEEEQTRKLLTSWMEHQVAEVIDTAVANKCFTTSVRIPLSMRGQNNYVQSYLEDFGYHVSISSETVYISWRNA